MSDSFFSDWPSPEALQKALAQHRRELARIRRMTDRQFEVFRTNFAIGAIDIARGEAIDLLSTMIGTNLRMQDILRRRKK